MYIVPNYLVSEGEEPKQVQQNIRGIPTEEGNYAHRKPFLHMAAIMSLTDLVLTLMIQHNNADIVSLNRVYVYMALFLGLIGVYAGGEPVHQRREFWLKVCLVFRSLTTIFLVISLGLVIYEFANAGSRDQQPSVNTINEHKTPGRRYSNGTYIEDWQMLFVVLGLLPWICISCAGVMRTRAYVRELRCRAPPPFSPKSTKHFPITTPARRQVIHCPPKDISIL